MKALDARRPPNGCISIFNELREQPLCGNFTLEAQAGLCYCETVKNITVSVPDELYHNARVKAAEQGTTVSAIVRKNLEALTSGQDKSQSLLQRIREFRDSRQNGPHFSASSRLSREETHDRNALRRHERSAL